MGQEGRERRCPGGVMLTVPMWCDGTLTTKKTAVITHLVKSLGKKYHFVFKRIDFYNINEFLLRGLTFVLFQQKDILSNQCYSFSLP